MITRTEGQAMCSARIWGWMPFKNSLSLPAITRLSTASPLEGWLMPLPALEQMSFTEVLTSFCGIVFSTRAIILIPRPFRLLGAINLVHPPEGHLTKIVHSFSELMKEYGNHWASHRLSPFHHRQLGPGFFRLALSLWLLGCGSIWLFMVCRMPAC